MLHIKKYANGRFFDTKSKKYIKQDQLADMIKNNEEEIKVTLTKSGKDVTARVIEQLSTDKPIDKKAAEKAKKAEKRAARRAEKKARKEAMKETMKEAKKETKKNGKKEMHFLKTDKLVKWVGELIDDKIEKVLDIVKLPSKEQVAQLDENIQALNKKLDELKLTTEKKSAEEAVQETIEEALEEMAQEEAGDAQPATEQAEKTEQAEETVDAAKDETLDQENVDQEDAKTNY